MQLLNIASIEFKKLEPTAIGIGTFDGVHKAHKILINKVIETAKLNNLKSALFCFDHPPKRILFPNSFLGEITLPEEKFAILQNFGLDYIVFRQFDANFAKISPQDFVLEYLLEKLNAKFVCVGFNFNFGINSVGNAEILCELLSKIGCRCIILPPVLENEILISSSKIRELISAGKIEEANKLLDREYSFSGVVVHGDHRGRILGFPTANLKLANTTKIIPPNGVYICTVDYQSKRYKSVVNIGIRPTFGKSEKLLEAHLIDFNGNLYQSFIRVNFYKKLREEIRFNTVEELKQQIKQDILAVKGYFTKKCIVC